MTDALLDPLRHNDWATKQLLGFCRDLTPEQLNSAAEGTYGSIIATLQHLIGAESRYLFRLTDARPDWSGQPEDTEDLAELERMVDDASKLWDEAAGGDFDPDRVISWISQPSGDHCEAHAGMLVAQNLNHGNEHRAQIFTVLTTIGIEPPELDGWAYGWANGRFKETPQGS